jgi:hypothetical protein
VTRVALLILLLVVALAHVGPASAREHRSREVTREFQREHPCPSTGRTTGPFPGYWKDHIVPLACGEPDAVSNLQWQRVADRPFKRYYLLEFQIRDLVAMKNLSLLSLSTVFALMATGTEAQTQVEMNQAVDAMVRLCVAGGESFSVSGGGTGGADISLRSFDAKGNINGNFQVEKRKAEGLVAGIDNAMTQVAADQAEKVRSCLEPVRQRLLEVLFPKKK